MNSDDFGHIPVLYEEILSNLPISQTKTNIIIDCTLGLGGHAIGIIQKICEKDIFIGFDADAENLALAKSNIFKKVGSQIVDKKIKTYFIHSNFSNLKEELEKINIKVVTGIYYDLGVNSIHFDDPDKGFSFRFDSNLDMRFDKINTLTTASDIVNSYHENELIRIFREYSDEPKAKFIADEILKTRKTKPIETTKELESLIEKSSFDSKSKVRVFQALRMEVNKEMEVIEESLRQAIDLLEKDGILQVITFHSVEDRTVKQVLAEFLENKLDDKTGQILEPKKAEKVYKKPIVPTQEEIYKNKRSRSAKLRIIKKL
ncbi:MAG: 16S rRNA (cytosine(1402)-N(4))-methyltransferase RsmH [Candidatus Gracilibacteria bacterium]|nr:16S rRNA (cytosine(1402)-N(4))-methyltransferase RsmH [Candidatus Gracilibacteria bacterium]MDD4530486.1 16S rRNA (cytosine(1402)-N(4))-methyltransferase RsmH [Candidatus Gracilibacteria bacterium]